MARMESAPPASVQGSGGPYPRNGPPAKPRTSPSRRYVRLLRRQPRRALGCAFRGADAVEHEARQGRLGTMPLGEAHDRALEFIDLGRTAALEIFGGRRSSLRIDRQHAPG